MAGLLNRVRVANQLRDRDFAEPYAGGAGAALTLLFRKEAPAIHINDVDEAVSDIWWAVLERIDQFSEMIHTAPLTVDEWLRQRAIYRDPRSVSRLERAFAAFYLNRCNRSGIIRNGGPIGGIEQTGKWRLDAPVQPGGLGGALSTSRSAEVADPRISAGRDRLRSGPRGHKCVLLHRSAVLRERADVVPECPRSPVSRGARSGSPDDE